MLTNCLVLFLLALAQYLLFLNSDVQKFLYNNEKGSTLSFYTNPVQLTISGVLYLIMIFVFYFYSKSYVIIYLIFIICNIFVSVSYTNFYYKRLEIRGLLNIGITFILLLIATFTNLLT